MHRKDVFVSATTADLGSYREVAKQALLDIGAHPIEQTNFPTDYRQLLSMLAQRLDPCDAVVHIVGFYYGAEPDRAQGVPRRSYTQWEYFRATTGERPKPTFVFLARPECHFDSTPKEDEAKTRLQLKYRDFLKSRGTVYYEFSTPAELRELIHRADELRVAGIGRGIRMPFLALGSQFIGREDILRVVPQQLADARENNLGQPSVLFAEGGVGKTTAAVEIGWRAFENEIFDYVFLLNASFPEMLNADLAGLTAPTCIDLSEDSSADQSVRLRAVLRWLSNEAHAARTLIIFDSADAPEAVAGVRQLLPKLTRCGILITSRADSWHDMLCHRLELFTKDEARAFLQSRLKVESNEESHLDAIADAVDHLPLALELVASYMQANRQAPEDWLREWRTAAMPTLQYHDEASIRYPVALARVWDLTIRRLSYFARNLLYTLSWIAPRPNIYPLWPMKDEHWWPKYRQPLVELAKASLIRWDLSAEGISVHRMLQMVCRVNLTPEQTLRTLEAALQSVSNLCPHPNYTPVGWKLWPLLKR